MPEVGCFSPVPQGQGLCVVHSARPGAQHRPGSEQTLWNWAGSRQGWGRWGAEGVLQDTPPFLAQLDSRRDFSESP